MNFNYIMTCLAKKQNKLLEQLNFFLKLIKKYFGPSPLTCRHNHTLMKHLLEGRCFRN